MTNIANIVFNIEVLLDPIEEEDWDTSEFYKAMFEYEDHFRLNKPDKFPCGAYDCHGVDRGLCFLFHSKEEVNYAREHMLKDEYFVNFMKKYPKYCFTMPEWLIRGMDSESKKVILNNDGKWEPDEKWNEFIDTMNSS